MLVDQLGFTGQLSCVLALCCYFGHISLPQKLWLEQSPNENSNSAEKRNQYFLHIEKIQHTLMISILVNWSPLSRNSTILKKKKKVAQPLKWNKQVKWFPTFLLYCNSSVNVIFNLTMIILEIWCQRWAGRETWKTRKVTCVNICRKSWLYTSGWQEMILIK